MAKLTNRFYKMLAAIIALLVIVGLIFAGDIMGLINFQLALNKEESRSEKYGIEARALAQACELCHGLEGNVINGDYPSLAGQPVGYLVAQLNNFADGSRKNPIMQPLAMNLSFEEKQLIANYYAQFPLVRNNYTNYNQASLTQGKALVASCVSCHGSKLEGGAIIGTTIVTPALANQSREYLVHQLVAFRDGTRQDRKGGMNAVAINLTDDDIENIANYLVAGIL